RNTAPALAVSALFAEEQDDSAVLLVLSADHMIKDVARFQQAIAIAVDAAVKNHLVTFGIEPTHPETGYGYINTVADAAPYKRVSQFVEKPDLKTAESYLQAGCYFWNSGMFVFRARQFLEELAHQSPDVFEASGRAKQLAHQDLDFI